MPQASKGPTGECRRPATGEAKQDDPVGSWNLGGPSAEAMAGGAGALEETLERRTRRTHCVRPCGSSGVMERCLSVSLIGFAYVRNSRTKGCHRGP